MMKLISCFKGAVSYQTANIAYTLSLIRTTTKERITFLKKHYGWGGSYTGLYNENHDAKGITFSHGDLTKPYAKIQISWSEAEKHIDRLIKIETI